MKRPLVVLDALLLRPRPTGVGRSIQDWTRALAAAERPCDFAVLCTSPELLPHLAERPGWRLVRCPGATGGTLRKAAWTQLAMPRLLRRLGADLLHCLQFVAPLRCDCPTVVTVHDLGYLRYPHTTEQPRRAYYQQLVPRSLQRAAAIFCNSQATADDVEAWFPACAPRLAVVPWGVPQWVQQRPVRDDRDPAAPFLFVGTLEPRKNLERLLLAYAEFQRRREARQQPSPQLVLVGGRGWRDSALRQVLAPLAAAGTVVVMDYCDQDDLWRQYSLARALLLPSLHEGFGFPILEAMAAGTPVLTSDCGAMAEVAGDAALLVDPLDQEGLIAGLERLADDPGLRRELVARGRTNLARWTWEPSAQAACEAYQRILAAGRGERTS
jgi:glycosyltransferase involved in cell wall biosynthesis